MHAPSPDRSDPDNGAFWEGTDRGELRIKSCAACGRQHWPPRLGCPTCGSERVEWTPVASRGAIYSWTIVHRSLTPGFTPPYAVVLVELADAPGVRMIGNLLNLPYDRIEAGLPVEAVFTPASDGQSMLVCWQPAGLAEVSNPRA